MNNTGKRCIDYLSCPVCGEEKIRTAMPHADFDGYCIFICANKICGHGWTDYKEEFAPEGYFKTFRPRADLYRRYLQDNYAHIGSLLEIGSSGDFYFLNELKNKIPEMVLYVHDVVDYTGKTPSGIDFVRDLSEMPFVDVVYMCHSLEHVIDMNFLLQMLKGMCKSMLIEVPGNPDEKWDYVRKKKWGTGYHYQFFNEKSLPLLFEKNGFKVVKQALSEIIPRSNIPYNPPNNLFIEVEVAE